MERLNVKQINLKGLSLQLVLKASTEVKCEEQCVIMFVVTI